ncbi:DUF2087 domain-containing protein [Nocardioides sp.]|uniref:DUF2087 domain-containing protein n=1 Tax=Nocardioides sp. TaxID=35761 RepID=UPI00351122E8
MASDPLSAEEDRRRVLQRFFTPDGRLMTIPVRHVKRQVVLDHLVQRFELGVVYPESEVRALLSEAHPDHAALRRYLVEDGFLAREDGRYWRCGGTVDLDGV